LKTIRHKKSLPPAPAGETAGLHARLAEAEGTLRAIRTGEVDTVMVAGKEGSQVFTLDGAEHAYRVLIESMNEGALMLMADKTILFANQCFANMVKCPLEQVTGSSFRRFLSAADQATLKSLLKRSDQFGAKTEMLLHASDATQVPARLSVRPLARNGFKSATFGLVVTDMTEARRNEEMLRALTHRVVQTQEAERGRVALDLHDHITQLLCAVLVRSQTLADQLPASEGPLKREALKLRELLGQTADEVERISRNLRPGALEQLGLDIVLRDTSVEFAKRTGVAVNLTCVSLTVRLPGDIELALYRILQEALQNVAAHAHARHVQVSLRKQDGFVQLVIHDDGISFRSEPHPASQKKRGRLGLISMRERAAYVGGSLSVKSAPGKGTTITVQIPLGKIRAGRKSSS
jgi:signal transduction histidine kinase